MKSNDDKIATLTEAEHDAIQALIRHGNNQRAADELGLKLQTIKNELSSAYRKLGVGSGTSAVVMYDRWMRGLDEPWLQRFRDACSDAHIGWFLYELNSRTPTHSKDWSDCPNPTCQSRLKAAYGENRARAWE